MLVMFQMFAKIGFVICFIMIGWLSLSDGHSVVQVGSYDKIVHLLSYLCLSSCFYFGFFKKAPANKMVLITIVALIAYGVLIEWLQGFVPGRFPSFLDAVANSAGVVLGWVVVFVITLKYVPINRVEAS